MKQAETIVSVHIEAGKVTGAMFSDPAAYGGTQMSASPEMLESAGNTLREGVPLDVFVQGEDGADMTFQLTLHGTAVEFSSKYPKHAFALECSD